MNKEILKILENDSRVTPKQIATMTGIPAAEVTAIQSFMATGKPVLLIGENSSWSAWDNGILSAVGGSYSFTEVDHPITPTRGKSLSASLQFSGSFLGGSVNQIEPMIDVAHFRPGLKPKHVIASGESHTIFLKSSVSHCPP